MKIKTLLVAALALTLAACEGAEGPTGPQGPQGPIGATGPAGPVGPGIQARVFETSGFATNTTTTTAVQATGGNVPGAVCFMSFDNMIWATFALSSFDGVVCGVVASGSGYYGSAVIPSALVGAVRVRIILFWEV